MRSILSRTIFCEISNWDIESLSVFQSDNLLPVSNQAYKCMAGEVVPVRGIAVHLQGETWNEVVDYAQKINDSKQGRIKYVAVNGCPFPTLFFDATCKGDAYETACKLIEILQKSPIKHLQDCFVFETALPDGTCHLCGIFVPELIPEGEDKIPVLLPMWRLWREKTEEKIKKLPGFMSVNFVPTGLKIISD